MTPTSYSNHTEFKKRNMKTLYYNYTRFYFTYYFYLHLSGKWHVTFHANWQWQIHSKDTSTMGGNPRGGGTRPPPHDFEGGGHNIKCPPPHVFVGRTIFRRKKVSEPPPPPRSSAFLGVARLWAGGGWEKTLCPPIIRFGFPPLTSTNVMMRQKL